MNAIRLRKLTALTKGAAILSIGVSACAKSEPIVNAPETQATASATSSAAQPPTNQPPTINAPPMPRATEDAASSVQRIEPTDGGKRPPFMNAPPHRPPVGNTP